MNNKKNTGVFASSRSNDSYPKSVSETENVLQMLAANYAEVEENEVEENHTMSFSTFPKLTNQSPPLLNEPDADMLDLNSDSDCGTDFTRLMIDPNGQEGIPKVISKSGKKLMPLRSKPPQIGESSNTSMKPRIAEVSQNQGQKDVPPVSQASRVGRIWNAEEDKNILEAHKEHGKNWKLIAEIATKNTRTPRGVQDWITFLKTKKTTATETASGEGFVKSSEEYESEIKNLNEQIGKLNEQIGKLNEENSLLKKKEGEKGKVEILTERKNEFVEAVQGAFEDFIKHM